MKQSGTRMMWRFDSWYGTEKTTYVEVYGDREERCNNLHSRISAAGTTQRGFLKCESELDKVM